MGTRDPRIDSYIAKQRDFAKPILGYIREVVHEGCPDCEETLKWSMPTFLHHGILCGMAGFKEYAVMMFWKGTLIVGTGGKSLEAMGSLGRITRIEDLPPRKELLGYIKKAMELNEKGVKAPKKHSAPKKTIPMPADLKTALAKNKKAKSTYEEFSPSAKREYLEWIIDAKAEDTRKRRLQQAVEWMAEGKTRNWKYM
jgi:uncharacterized protein YdeI (YjbR/CyaY-like superfamily)